MKASGGDSKASSYPPDTALADALDYMSEGEFANFIDSYASGFIQGHRRYLAVWRGDSRVGSVKVFRGESGRWCYKDHAEGSGGDLVAWLMDWAGLTFPEAKEAVLGKAAPVTVPRVHKPKVVTAKVPLLYAPPWVESLQQRAVAELARDGLPPIGQRRGWTVPLATALGIGRDGLDILYPVFDPNGRLKALKRRYGTPRRGGQRFEWIPAKPADDCSYWNMAEAKEVIIVEGEGKGATLTMALGDFFAVCAAAGTSGRVFAGIPDSIKAAYILPDAPKHVARRGGEIVDVSLEAALRWKAQVEAAGVACRILPSIGDACDYAHANGLDGLRDKVRGLLDG
jgi:hypothetical protein